jgi:hypothetical protein
MATTSQLPFIVIDQNRLRDANMVASTIEQCRENGLEVLVPDVAGFEFSKAIDRPEDALRTWRCSLQHLASSPELVVAGRKLPDLWNEELATGTPVIKVVDDKATPPLRDLLRGINASESTLRSFVTERVARIMPASLEHWSQHEGHREMLVKVRDLLKPYLSEGTIKNLRKNTSAAVGSWMASADAVRFVFQGLKHAGAADKVSLCLATQPSVYGGLFSGMAAIVLYWLGAGGLDLVDPKKATNDLHDLEYAILGALSHALVTTDKRLGTIEQAIRGGYAGRGEWLGRALPVSSI